MESIFSLRWDLDLVMWMVVKSITMCEWLEGFCKLGKLKWISVDDFGVWIDLFGMSRFKV